MKAIRIASITFLFLCLAIFNCLGQGMNHQFLLGYDVALFDTNVTSTKARLLFDSVSYNLVPDNFKMPFEAAQSSISDQNGNLLMLTNGCWIADATGDTMLNGGGLNPGQFATDWCDNTTGIPYEHSNVFLPFPNDSSKYVLFHQVVNSSAQYLSTELYMSIIDLSMNGGLGALTQKNIKVIQDTLNSGLNACKHANGRDWWIVVLKANSDSAYKLLLTPAGVSSITIQALGLPSHRDWAGQPQFSSNGLKFAFHNNLSTLPYINEINLLDFDRCSGWFSNPQYFSLQNSNIGIGLAFSANSKYLYYSSFEKVYQLNIDTSDILASIDTVAVYDGYSFPYSFLKTKFWLMYLAANGRIYISSGNGVIDMHYISAPDSDGVSCNVMQHAIRTPCYFFRSNALHPNYYLGPVIGSACDTLAHVGLQEHLEEVQNFQIAPNPIKEGPLKITYLLPQNLPGHFELHDLNGKLLYSMPLAPWSSLQYINLPPLANGVYQCSIRSGVSRVSRKMVVVR